MRLLVYHAGALGDFITIVPCLRLLRLELPAAEVTLLGRPAFGELARDSGLIDRVLDASSASLAACTSPDDREVPPLFSRANSSIAEGIGGRRNRGRGWGLLDRLCRHFRWRWLGPRIGETHRVIEGQSRLEGADRNALILVRKNSDFLPGVGRHARRVFEVWVATNPLRG